MDEMRSRSPPPPRPPCLLQTHLCAHGGVVSHAMMRDYAKRDERFIDHQKCRRRRRHRRDAASSLSTLIPPSSTD